jgi:hypothetical protein
MSKGFEERRQKHEEKWALDAELRFKTAARRDKLFGLWAAAELGLSEKQGEEYAKALMSADLRSPGQDASFRKVRDDLSAAGRPCADAELRQKVEEFAELAHRQIVGDSN